ncbi:MAG: NADH-quinone oxidoreductase subunit NuoI, partial [Arsenicicoccus sp.]
APLIYEKHQLLAPLRPDMLTPPFPMAEGMEERDYYQGKVTGSTQGQRSYVEQRDADTVDAAAARAEARPEERS